MSTRLLMTPACRRILLELTKFVDVWILLSPQMNLFTDCSLHFVPTLSVVQKHS